MKKIATIILFVLYGVASSGATIHFHYCMDKLQGVGLTTETKERCVKCGMSKAKNACCKDVHKTIKGQKDYQHASVSFTSPLFITGGQGCNITPQSIVTHSQPEELNSRPPPGPVSLFTLFCTYRI